MYASNEALQVNYLVNKNIMKLKHETYYTCAWCYVVQRAFGIFVLQLFQVPTLLLWAGLPPTRAAKLGKGL